VYIEDTVQTHFDVEVGTAPEGNRISLFSHETTTDLGYGTSRSKDPQDSSQATGVEIVQRRRLAARPSPVTILPNNSVDPFFKSPGRLNEQGREALDHSKYHVEHIQECQISGTNLTLRKYTEALFIHSLQCSIVDWSIESEKLLLSSSC
jgi:hypothetical protein